MSKLKLTVNETKTRVCKLPEEKFDFLGYTFGRCYSPKTGRAYLGTVPSKKRVQRICRAISDETGRNTTLLDPEDDGGEAQPDDDGLGQLLLSWGQSAKPIRAVEQHARRRLRQWLCAKHKETWPAIKRFLRKHPCMRYVVWSDFAKRTANLPWAKA